MSWELIAHYLPLLGILVVVAGFALKLNPMLVVTVAAFVTGSIEQEGVILDNFLLVEGGKLREADLRALLASGPYPARNPDQNVADLAAQVAACARGAKGLLDVSADYGTATVQAYMAHVQDYAEAAVRRLIPTLSSGSFQTAWLSSIMYRGSNPTCDAARETARRIS